jgi:hypothetical protein
MKKFVASKKFINSLPGFKEAMKESLYWHAKSEPYTKEMHPLYGKKHLEETKALISKAAKKRIGKKNSFYGKQHSEETRKNWSILRSDPKNGLCKSYGMLGKKHSKESLKKISKSSLGRKHTKESIAKMSLIKKKYWEKKRNENCI